MVQLSRDQEFKPHLSEGLEGHHLAVEIAAGDQCSLWTALGGRQDQSIGARLLLLPIGLFSSQAAMARPWLYVSTFSYSGTGEECLKNAAEVLKEEGFTRNFEVVRFKKSRSKGGHVDGKLRNFQW